VARPDPRSGVLERLCTGPALAKFNTAINYLKQVPQAHTIIGQLQNSGTNFDVEIVDHPSASSDPNFDAVHNLVTWNPNVALEWNGNLHSYHAHSPAVLLMHELGHAYEKVIDPARFFRLTAHATHDGRWNNLEEKQTVLHVENPIANALGEGERFFHENSSFFDGHFYAALEPTSTRHAPQQSSFTPLASQTARRDDPQLFALLHRALRALKQNNVSG
jgi:hypothetical protein